MPLTQPMSMRLQVLVLVVLTGLGGALWMVRKEITGATADVEQSAANTGKTKAKRGKKRRVPVIVARVQLAKNEEIVAAIGTGRANRSVMIHAKTDGVIVAFKPRPGGKVRKGDLIFRLDNTQAELAVRIAKKRLEEASRLLDRSKILKRRRVSSGARVADAATSRERAVLELKQAQELLSDLSIRAPFDGILGIAKVEVGDRVTTATSIISLDARNEILAEFEVAEKFAARISVGDPVTAVTPSHEGKRFAGRIQNIDSRIDPVSRTLMVRAAIPNKNNQLLPGMSFAVELALSGESFSAVPELSLQWRKGESYVWVVRDEMVHKVVVQTIKRLNSIILVAGKLTPGNLVVVEGVQRLRHGSSVFYKPPKTTKPAIRPEERQERSRASARRRKG